MAQHDYVIANGTGAAVRSDLNNALAAIVSQNSGATAPATTYAFQFWADTTTGLLKLRNSANSAWITLFQLDGEWSTLPVENGTAAAPSIYFKDSGTDTGFYSPGTDQVGISTGGTARLTIDANGNLAVDTNTLYVDAPNNRVGIGSSNPQTLLHLSNTAQQRFNCLSTANAISFWKDGTPTFAAEVGIGGATGITSTMKFDIYNGSAWNTAMTIDSSSRVGIGTASPGAPLHVKSTNPQVIVDSPDASTESRVRWYKNGSSVGQINTNSGNLQILSESAITFTVSGGSPSESARLDSSGRWLLGTSTARSNFFNTTLSSRLQVEGASHNDASVSIVRNENGATPWLVFGSTRGTTVGSTTVLQNGDGCGGIAFLGSDGTEFVDAARIVCEVDGTPGANDMPGRLVFQTTADGASSPTERMRIRADGQIVCVATYDNTTANAANVHIFTDKSLGRSTSSIKYKENVENLQDIYADAILNCRPVWYQSKCTNDNPDWGYWGFIAEEVEQIDPRLCHYGADENGDQVVESVQYDRFVPHLLNLIKRQKGQIEAMEARLTALESA